MFPALIEFTLKFIQMRLLKAIAGSLIKLNNVCCSTIIHDTVPLFNLVGTYFKSAPIVLASLNRNFVPNEIYIIHITPVFCNK